MSIQNLKISIRKNSIFILVIFSVISCPSSGQKQIVSSESQNTREVGKYKIVDTGQKKCFDNSSEIDAPKHDEPFYGQDAQFDGNKPSYTYKGDGTITDFASKLMWDQNDSKKSMNWEEALAFAQEKNEENYLGYNDWRLPNAKELQSLLDYSRSPQKTKAAAINSWFSVTEILDERGETNYPFYWSSTTHEGQFGGEYAIYICFGEALGYMKEPWQNKVELMDVHGAGAQRSDPKFGDPDKFPQGHGPQGDVIRINNFVRLVRDN